MTDKPPLLLVMSPELTRGMILETSLARLRKLAKPLRLEPLARLDDPAHDALLRDCEVFLTGWGCPPLDAAAFERAPRLKALFHSAGTVRPFVTDACWSRGLVISSAATANAIPVAEYTLAAILFANKGVFALQRRYGEERQMRLWGREMPRMGNLHKRVGLVGTSRVGLKVIELLRPFDLEVRVSDPFFSETENFSPSHTMETNENGTARRSGVEAISTVRSISFEGFRPRSMKRCSWKRIPTATV